MQLLALAAAGPAQVDAAAARVLAKQKDRCKCHAIGKIKKAPACGKIAAEVGAGDTPIGVCLLQARQVFGNRPHFPLGHVLGDIVHDLVLVVVARAGLEVSHLLQGVLSRLAG